MTGWFFQHTLSHSLVGSVVVLVITGGDEVVVSSADEESKT